MIVFENDGLIDMRAATTFGVSAKVGDSPIGFFGTGFKMAVGVILRNGGSITLYRGCAKYEFGKQLRRIRGKTVHIVTMNGDELGFTTDVGKNWKAWQAYRELHANALDEGGSIRVADAKERGEKGKTKIIVDWSGIDEAFADADKIFLSTKPAFDLGEVEAHPGESRIIYYRGLRVFELTKPTRFTYNLTGYEMLTEDRTLRFPSLLPGTLANAIAGCDCAEVIEAVLTAKGDFYEQSIDFSDASSAKVSDTFLRVAQRLKADNAIRVRGAKGLFTEAASTREEFVGEFYVEPTIVEREIIEEAKALLTSRCPNLTFPYARVLKGTGRDSVWMTASHIDIPSDVLHQGPNALARQLLKALASHHSDRTASDWLVDLIIDRVATLRGPKANDDADWLDEVA
ncbi:hypothetical protein JF546_02675 [Nitratireductor aquimarinus]|uniref:hypothetical protein n=1 Tax=Nitratireductor aquimarinus TaxID=889300 RepID=UPI001A8CF7A1|nr:hypothetical protein [Nitratireductor aquimarinus]MBN8241913.1 hypothetical protein [Nitratireductor aquimarinus]MBY6130299.1 hypothetical protein [Nitratireductor aquimarinus]MCA1305072.1 hypothetical protein [Nitratireductor aquimarinus]